MIDKVKSVKITEGVVCPLCYRHVHYPVPPQQNQQLGYVKRTYYSLCQRCEIGFDVVQFYRDGKWVIEKYLIRKEVDGRWAPDGDWVKECEPTPLPLIKTGQGDYEKALSEKELIERIDKIRMAAGDLFLLLSETTKQLAMFGLKKEGK